MKIELALKHSLLSESKKLVTLAKSEGQFEVAQCLTALSETLEVTYDQQSQRYFISTTPKEKKISYAIDQQAFEFYQRGDSEVAPAKQKNYRPGEDPGAINNQNKSKEILLQLLAEENLAAPIATRTSKSLMQSLTTSKDWLPWLVVLMIAGISAAITYYQGTRTFNLIDNTYTLEASWRILNGEIPYRDFNLIVMPGIYVKQALLMKVFGNQAIVGVWWCMIAMFSTVLLTYLILKLIETPRWLGVALCLIAAGGGNIVRPYVWYDVDAMLFCLASAALCLWSEKKTSLSKYVFALGVLTTLPLLFKQNLGVAHLVIITAIIYFQWAIYPHRVTRGRVLAYHLGILFVLAILIIPFWWLNALPQMIHHTFFLASQLRVRDSVMNVLWGVFPVLPPNSSANVLTYPLPFFSTSFLTWGAFILGMGFWFVGTHRNIFLLLMPLWIFGISLAGIYALGTASIFPLMPLLAIMIALIRGFIKHFPKVGKFSDYVFYPATIAVAILLLLHGLAGYQLFFYDQAFGTTASFQTARLKGLSSSPEVVAGLDQLVGFIEQLPANDTIALLPTEDPIYFLTNRKSPLHILQRYRQSGGDPDGVYLPELQRVNPTWLVIKTKPQFQYYQPESQRESAWIKANYEMAEQVNQYLIWKRVDHGKP